MLSALHRNKGGAALIALQLAVTLAILCNALFIVQQHLAKTARPSGVDEADVFTIVNQWLGNPSHLRSSIQADVAALRAMPAVKDAYESNSQPLLQFGNEFWGITLHPDQPRSMKMAAVYFGDQDAMDTLGFKLSAGHGFSAADITDFEGLNHKPTISGVLVTRALARQLAPDGQVLGHIASLWPTAISGPIVGIIDTLQVPPVNLVGNEAAEDSIVLPYRYLAPIHIYIVRAKPGELAQAMKAAQAVLARVSRQRVLIKVQSLADARRAIYRGDRTLARILTVVCVALLAVTAFGIVGLTSYWVSQRWRQIGIRRALGATRLTIMQHFHAENILISASGIAVGVALAVAANLWIVRSFAMGRLPISYLIIGVVAMLALAQLAVLWPALRAASVPPAVATRSV
jgi:putative ABC transport system permease protein